MPDKFQNRYRISSARLRGYDYSRRGLYFVTICTKKCENYFGYIADAKMHLSSMGVLADVFWYEMKNHTENIELHEFVVMPNHIHGIIEITESINSNVNNITLGNIVGGYKSAITKHAHRLGYEFEWQTRFYDNIIRNENAYSRISEYIANNIKKWNNDKFYTDK